MHFIDSLEIAELELSSVLGQEEAISALSAAGPLLMPDDMKVIFYL